MDQTSTFGPYFFLESSSGAAYAGLPHWVLNGSEYPKMPAQLLRPKSEGQNNWDECCFWVVVFFFFFFFFLLPFQLSRKTSRLITASHTNRGRLALW